MKRPLSGIFLLLTPSVFMVSAYSAPVIAATFNVNTSSDGIGDCTTGNGVCTLRTAIQQANTLGGTNTIILPSGEYVLSQKSPCPFLSGNETILCVASSVNLVGAGANTTIIDGNGQGPTFLVSGPTLSVMLTGVTIRNAHAVTGFGGGIYNQYSALTLMDCVLLANSGNQGGGIYNDHGTLTLINTDVNGNSSTDGGGGISNHFGTTRITNSTISGNLTGNPGGGIDNFGGTVNITGSTISGNTSALIGGGISNFGTGEGGVIFNAVLNLTDSTVSRNSSGSDGGGIYNHFNTNQLSSTVNINGGTISANTSGTAGAGGGGIFNNGGTVNLKNTILAGNKDLAHGFDDCATSPVPPPLNSQGYNLIGNTAGCSIGGDSSGNITGQNPKLSVLANNGGPTQTMALLPGSPAIDAGSPAVPGTGGNACAVTDQRGLFRPSAKACDIGAFEAFGTLSVSGVLPNSGGDTGPVVTVVSGSAFASGARVKLARSGQQAIVGNPVTVDPGGSAMATTFDLTNAQKGAWDLVVTNPDGTFASLASGFTISPANALQLWVDVAGPTQVRPGLPAPYTVLFGNRGNVDLAGVTLGLLIPQNYGLTPLFPIASPPPQTGQVFTDWRRAPITALPNANGFVSYPLFIPVVPAGFTGALSFELTVPTTAQEGSRFSIVAGINQPYFDPVLDPQVLSTIVAGAKTYAQQNLGVTIPSSLDPSLGQYLTNQLQSAITDGRTAFVDSLARQIEPYSLDQLLIDLAAFGAASATASLCKTKPLLGGTSQLSLDPGAGDTCVVCCSNGVTPPGCSCSDNSPPCPPPGEPPPPKPVSPAECADMAGFHLVPDTLNGGMVCAPNTCICVNNDFPSACGSTFGCVNGGGGVAGSVDPNNKVGAHGIGAPQFVSDTTPLHYAISFTNEASATAPAQTVVITDQLDTSQLDLSTFSPGPISFGSVAMLPPPGSSHFTGGVDLTPFGQNVFVQVEVNVNKDSGLLTWRFTSLDPISLQLTENPLKGFLPPDTKPPNGEGNVLFTVQPKPGLTTGTQIQNQGQVVFDVNPPLRTPVWTNTLDVTPPVTHVLALPATETSTNFLVQWTGTDAGSGIQGFTIYVSDNRGPFSVWQRDTALSSATYSGHVGHTYGFYSIGQDFVGNIEPAKTTADAATQVIGVTSCAQDVSAQVTIVRSGYGYDFATGRFVQTVTLKNSGSSAIAIPVSLVLDNLSANASLFTPSGTTTCAAPLGSPFINVSNLLNPGASVSLQLQFTDPTKAGITYTTRILAGRGER